MILGTEFSRIIEEDKETTILGYYGMDNFGDDLMLKGILGQLENHGLKVNILSYKKINWLSKENYPNVKVFIWPKSKIGKYKIFKKASENSRTVFWGGGTCFTDEDGDGYFKYMVYAKLLGKKVGYLGVGIGNLNKSSRLLKTKILINISSILTFRDKTSQLKALSWKKKASKAVIELVEDPANYTLESLISNLPSNIKGNNLVIAWRDLIDYSKTTIGSDLLPVAKMALRICDKFKLNKVVIMDTDSVRDHELSLTLKGYIETLSETIIVVYNNSRSYEEKLRILNDSKVILTSRLHIAVAAKYLKKDCYVYNYSPKISYFVEEESNDKIQLIEKDLTIKSA